MEDKKIKNIKIKLKARLQAYTQGAIPTKTSHLVNDVPFLDLSRVMDELTKEEQRRGRLSLGIATVADVNRLVIQVPINKDMWGTEGCVVGFDKHQLYNLYGISVQFSSVREDDPTKYDSLTEEVEFDSKNNLIIIKSVLPWEGVMQIVTPIDNTAIPEGDYRLLYDSISGELLYDEVGEELVMG